MELGIHVTDIHVDVGVGVVVKETGVGFLVEDKSTDRFVNIFQMKIQRIEYSTDE